MMPAGERPNVLFITADQWRGDALSGLGHPIVRTPHLDSLARHGVRFERHYAQAAPCGPSRACLYTGTYLHLNRATINGTPLDRRLTNLALEARAAGYQPAMFGYTDTAADPRGLAQDDVRLKTYEGILPGFDPVQPLLEDFEPWAGEMRARGFPFGHEKHAVFAPIRDETGPWRTQYGADDSETAFLTRAVIDWIGRQTAPWFAHVSYYRPHPPFVAPPPYHALYDPAQIRPPNRRSTLAEDAARHPYLAWALGQTGHRAPADRQAMAEMAAAYFGLMTQVDDAIGDLLYALRDLNQTDRTVVIFTSDHGEMLGDHWLRGKQGFFDGAYHVPLIVRDPRRPGSGRVSAFTEHVDLLATILDLIDAPVPRQTQGQSLRSFLEGQTPSAWRDAAHWEFDFRDPETLSAERHFGLPPEALNLAVIRDQDGKYVHFAGLPPLFFDLRRDPGETTDRADDPAYAATVARYAQRLLSWRQRSDDRTLTHWKLAKNGPFIGA